MAIVTGSLEKIFDLGNNLDLKTKEVETGESKFVC